MTEFFQEHELNNWGPYDEATINNYNDCDSDFFKTDIDVSLNVNINTIKYDTDISENDYFLLRDYKHDNTAEGIINHKHHVKPIREHFDISKNVVIPAMPPHAMPPHAMPTHAMPAVPPTHTIPVVHNNILNSLVKDIVNPVKNFMQHIKLPHKDISLNKVHEHLDGSHNYIKHDTTNKPTTKFHHYLLILIILVLIAVVIIVKVYKTLSIGCNHCPCPKQGD